MGFTGYYRYTFTLSPIDGLEEEEHQEIVMSEISDLPFESFENGEGCVLAYMPETETINENDLLPQTLTGVSHIRKELIPGENWNKVWEDSFEPIKIGNDIMVRAGFHPVDKSCTYDILIEPKMSFGTGHHATTYLMMQEMLTLPMQGKHVIDMGCGTGILAILAEKLNAAGIEAIDHDEQCIINTTENITLNNCSHIHTYTNHKIAPGLTADIVLANIQKNVLLEQMEMYAGWLKNGGTLLVSGIYEEAMETIVQKAAQYGFNKVNHTLRNGWCMVHLKK